MSYAWVRYIEASLFIAWRRRIRVGATTASWEPWRIWVTKVSDFNRGQHSLRRYGTAPAPLRKNSVCWKDFIRTYLDVMAATDFFTAEVLTWKGPITYYVLFFIHLETRRICVSGITRHPDQEWMEQQARAVTLEEWGFLTKHKYLQVA